MRLYQLAPAADLAASPPHPPLLCSPPIDMRVDRPFVFDIVHDATGLQLFTGEIYTPEKWAAKKED